VQFLDFEIELIEGCAKRTRQPVVIRRQRDPVRAKHTQIELGVEECDLQPIAGGGIPMRATTLEANAALRSIVRQDTGEGYEDFLTRLAKVCLLKSPFLLRPLMLRPATDTLL
jgi:hypothetical protein